jgi:haloalkane dehalogenase
MTDSAAPAAPGWLDREAYPFRSRWSGAAGSRLHYVDEGAGDAVLFVHGTPTWSFEFRHVIAALSPTSRCIAPDHLGFGLSDRPSGGDYSPAAHARRLAAFVTRLGLDRFTLVVHDFGGPIALPLALSTPSAVQRLVLINTWMWPFDDDAGMMRRGRLAGGSLGRVLYKYANASLRLLMPSAYGDRAKLTTAIHRQYLEVFRERRARVEVLHALARAILESRSYYADLYARADRLRDLPALIIWGMKDTAFQPHQLARWQSLLPAADVCRLASAGHWPQEEDPAAVTEALTTFLERTRAVHSGPNRPPGCMESRASP